MPKGFNAKTGLPLINPEPAQYPNVLKLRCGDDTLRQLQAIRERTGEKGRSEVVRRLIKLMGLHAEALMQFQEASLLFTRHREELAKERRFWALEFAFTTTMSAIMGEEGEKETEHNGTRD